MDEATDEASTRETDDGIEYGTDSGRGDDTGSGGGDGETELGVEPNLAAVIAYLSPPLTGILVLAMEEDDEFVRFHALQSIIFSIAATVVWFVLFGIGMVIGTATLGFGMILIVPVLFLVLFGFMGYGLFVVYKAYEGERYRIPYVADYADQHV